jgi:hypothetical protein
VPGAEIAVRVTPRAGRDAAERDGAALRVRVTAPAEGGRANRAAAELVAQALGVPKSRLELIRGAKARDKVFRLRPP